MHDICHGILFGAGKTWINYAMLNLTIKEAHHYFPVPITWFWGFSLTYVFPLHYHVTSINCKLTENSSLNASFLPDISSMYKASSSTLSGLPTRSWFPYMCSSSPIGTEEGASITTFSYCALPLFMWSASLVPPIERFSDGVWLCAIWFPALPELIDVKTAGLALTGFSCPAKITYFYSEQAYYT